MKKDDHLSSIKNPSLYFLDINKSMIDMKKDDHIKLDKDPFFIFIFITLVHLIVSVQLLIPLTV